MTEPVRLAIVGLGFMGKTHLAASQAAAKAGCEIEVVAVCDKRLSKGQDIDRTGGNLDTGCNEVDLSGLQIFDSVDELMHEPGIDAVSICTPTDSHVPLALTALAADKHVLVEKPVSLSVKAVRHLRKAAKVAHKRCVPGMCMRFWPGWSWLHATIRSGEYGRVQSASFQRLGEAPGWGDGFYQDAKRSGGALADLHIHDTDFVYWCFGRPDSVMSTGTRTHLTTSYHYKKGPSHVVAEGGWVPNCGFPFRLRYTVCFEGGTAEYDLAREDGVLRFFSGGEERNIELREGCGYEAEIRHFAELIRDPGLKPIASVRDAERVTEVLKAERKSLKTGEPRKLS